MTEKENIKIIKRYESFILGFCKCGCNKEITLFSKHRKKLKQYYHVSHSCIKCYEKQYRLKKKNLLFPTELVRFK